MDSKKIKTQNQPKGVFGWTELLSLSISRLRISRNIASSSSFSFVTMISLFHKLTHSLFFQGIWSKQKLYMEQNK